MWKKWAVYENFQDVIEFIKDLGDEDLSAHLQESSSTRAMFRRHQQMNL